VTVKRPVRSVRAVRFTFPDTEVTVTCTWSSG
jgi:hypothetical protein